jgi:hypothetical protein
VLQFGLLRDDWAARADEAASDARLSSMMT